MLSPRLLPLIVLVSGNTNLPSSHGTGRQGRQTTDDTDGTRRLVVEITNSVVQPSNCTSYLAGLQTLVQNSLQQADTAAGRARQTIVTISLPTHWSQKQVSVKHIVGEKAHSTTKQLHNSQMLLPCPVIDVAECFLWNDSHVYCFHAARGLGTIVSINYLVLS